MAAGFAQLKVDETMVEKLHRTGKDIPTPVQERAIPALLNGRDVIARAQTGVGKTLSFVIPLFDKVDPQKEFVQALILSPTRELAQQTAGEIRKLEGDTGIRTLTVSGGRDFEEEKRKIGHRAQVLVGTPGRLLDHLRKGNTSLGGVKYLVLDEVDEMLRQGFGEDIETLLSLMPQPHQTMMCSATLDEEVRKLGRQLTINPLVIDIAPKESTASTIHQICIKVSEDHKADALASLIRRYNPFLMLVFCCSKERAIALSDWLYGEGFNVDVLHGDMSQTKRRQVMENFRKAKLQILVASDIAARGLDVEGVTHVINYDVPHDANWYVHRVGRTGRAGKDGVAITLYTAEELNWLHNIESKLGITLEKQAVNGRPIVRRTRINAARKRAAAAKKAGTKPAAPRRMKTRQAARKASIKMKEKNAAKKAAEKQK